MLRMSPGYAGMHTVSNLAVGGHIRSAVFNFPSPWQEPAAAVSTVRMPVAPADKSSSIRLAMMASALVMARVRAKRNRVLKWAQVPKMSVIGRCAVGQVAEAQQDFTCRPAGRELEETAQDHVFTWLGQSPVYKSPCFTAVQRHFPNALPAKVVHDRTRIVLEKDFGFRAETTLLGSSFCPDEINNQLQDLPTLMRNYYGKIFPMGGIGGVPYVGETGFAAFSSHVGDDGDIIVVFGPHVGVSIDGKVGDYQREGQGKVSTACGAVIGAYKACLCNTGKSLEFNEKDMQMSEIMQEFAPHVKKLESAEDPIAESSYVAYEMVKDRMLRIVNTTFGSGRLVLIGGIQLNLPFPDTDDHFLPLMFEVRQEGREPISLMDCFVNPSIQQNLAFCPWSTVTAQREVFAWMNWSPPAASPLNKTLHKFFPGALPGEAVHRRVVTILSEYGFGPSNVLLGTSFCPDEINNTPTSMGVLMQDYWGEVFPMGGISGVAFTGVTGFAAFSGHVADNGHILVAFGPHVGISEEGEVGKIRRSGQAGLSSACGEVIGAYDACLAGWKEDGGAPSYDLEMDICKRAIAPYVASIQRTENPVAALTHQAYHMVQESVDASVNTNFGSGYLCLLGGIQINMPCGYADHFYPMRFELQREGQPTVNLLTNLLEFREIF